MILVFPGWVFICAGLILGFVGCVLRVDFVFSFMMCLLLAFVLMLWLEVFVVV